jgi:hypothetical protein
MSRPTDSWRSSRRWTLCVVALALTASACGTAPVVSSDGPAATQLRVNGPLLKAQFVGATLTLDTRTLATRLAADDGRDLSVSQPTPSKLGAPTSITHYARHAQWDYPKARLHVTAAADEHAGGLALTFTATSPSSSSSLSWPVTGGDRTVSSVEFANGSGQTIPIRDPFWLKQSAGLVDTERQFAGDLTLPAWGVTGSAARMGAGMYTTTDIGTSLGFKAQDGAIQAAAKHSFSSTTPSYNVVITPNDGSLIASARAYRQRLVAGGAFVSLRQKIKNNANVRKLLGAPHAYVWGTGRTAAAVGALAASGSERFWIGYDADGDVPSPAFVSAVSNYLVAPYDSWAGAEDPRVSTDSSNMWPGKLYPRGCVHRPDGTAVTGFGGRGCYLSSKALKQAQDTSGVITKRVAARLNGARSYFLDVDAVGQLFDDYSQAHRQTKTQDRALRLQRLMALSDGTYSGGTPLVVGSEAAQAWANPAIAFSHGSSTPVYDGLWGAEGDSQNYGGYWPAARPAFFFKPVDLPATVSKALFAPQYRVPLYETALHDSVVSTDRWELGIDKLPAVGNHRILLAMLYNEPLMYSLDIGAIKSAGPAIARRQQFYQFIQDAAGLEPLTDFQAVTDDHAVQRTTFGDGALVITANFSSKPTGGLQPGCVTAVQAAGDRKTLCP